MSRLTLTTDGIELFDDPAAERIGLDFVLSMMKFRGFGGDTGYWDACLESFTLMAGMGQPCATSPEEPFCDAHAAGESLAFMRSLLALCPPQVLDWKTTSNFRYAKSEEDLLRNVQMSVYAKATLAMFAGGMGVAGVLVIGAVAAFYAFTLLRPTPAIAARSKSRSACVS